MQQDKMLGKKINVRFPYYCKIERILKEDSNGLYVDYQNQKCSVKPDTNCLGEVIKGHYTGIHPNLVKLNKN